MKLRILRFIAARVASNIARFPASFWRELHYPITFPVKVMGTDLNVEVNMESWGVEPEPTCAHPAVESPVRLRVYVDDGDEPSATRPESVAVDIHFCRDEAYVPHSLLCLEDSSDLSDLMFGCDGNGSQ